MFYMHDLGWGWWMVMSIGMLAFWALVIYGIVWLIRSGQNVQQRDERPPDTPEEILKRRAPRRCIPASTISAIVLLCRP